jgi:hypothetical protein
MRRNNAFTPVSKVGGMTGAKAGFCDVSISGPLGYAARFVAAYF